MEGRRRTHYVGLDCVAWERSSDGVGRCGSVIVDKIALSLTRNDHSPSSSPTHRVLLAKATAIVAIATMAVTVHFLA
jgi:hypothetical protein